jgi:2-polyprenyl-3-methyl-5-hydroxy-6-metoxy-1,4-benzoquinol methylase
VTDSAQLASYFDRVASSFDAIYSENQGLVRLCWNRVTRQNIYFRFQFTMQALSQISGKRVLDVGCGSGRYSVTLAARGAKSVVGLDLSSHMIRIAERFAKRSGCESRCTFLCSGVLDYHDEELFDDVYSIGIL